MLPEMEHDKITLSLTSNPGTQQGVPEEASRRDRKGEGLQGEPGEEGQVLLGRLQGG